MDSTVTQPRSPRPRKGLLAIYFLLLAALTFAGAELIVRLKGARPYRPVALDVNIEPGGRFFVPDPAGGYAQLPGRFKVTLPDGFFFHVTHGSNGLRITHPPHPAGGAAPSKEIWILGCSLTHGWCLNDEETYPWLVQEAFPDYEVVNGGVEGYGTLQSRLQFQEMLARRSGPELVVLAYGTFQDVRNTFVRQRQKSIAPFNRLGPLIQPYARFNAHGDLDYFTADVGYREFPLMRASALVHFAEEKYNDWEVLTSRSAEVSAELIIRFASFCRENNIKFLLAGISSDSPAMLAYCQRRGVAAVDISVVLAEPGNTNLPHDNHPSAAANKVYAQKLIACLKQVLLEAPARVDP